MTVLSWSENYGDKIFQGFDMSALKRDDYYLNIINNSTHEEDINLYSTFEECIECPYERIENSITNYTTIQNSEHHKFFRFSSDQKYLLPRNETSNVICDVNGNFGEFGIYRIYINDYHCEVITVKEAVNIYIPIFTVFLIYAGLFCVLGGSVLLFQRFFSKSKKDVPEEKKKQRVKSLDTFRGISIVLMIFVNYGCGGYAIFDHAVWNGLHIADVIFPWFLWIMGVCIPISVTSLFKRGVSKKSAILNILRRSVILFLLGLFLGGSPYLNKVRIFGVLQRFGICYFVVATLCVAFHRKKPPVQGKYKSMFQDISKLEFEWIGILLIFILYEFLNYAVAAPGCPRGYTGPGGYHENSKYLNCTGGAAGYIDRIILSTNHMYQYPTIKHIYESLPFEPEGILSTLTSIIQVFFGVQAGTTLLVFKEHKNRLLRWAIWALVTGVVGGSLCEFKKDGGFIPINKNLWSLSFTLVTTGLAFALLCVCYFLVDVKKWWNGKPFLFAGMNSTIMYVGHSIVSSNFLFRWYLNSDSVGSTHFLTLLDNVWATGMWILVAYYLYKVKFFLSI